MGLRPVLGKPKFLSIGEVELYFGEAILPPGRRRKMLPSKIENLLSESFEGLILPFNSEATQALAKIAAARRFAGYSVATADCQIAAIARSRGMAVATRNVRAFE